jgi:hypothetical protein
MNPLTRQTKLWKELETKELEEKEKKEKEEKYTLKEPFPSVEEIVSHVKNLPRETLIAKFRHLLKRTEDGSTVEKPNPKEWEAEMTETNITAGVQFQKKFDEILKPELLKAGFHIIITSSFRNKEHNSKVGGAKDSAHLVDFAIDLKDTKDLKISNFLLKNPDLVKKSKLRFIIFYPNGESIVHIQNRFFQDKNNLILEKKTNKFLLTN